MKKFVRFAIVLAVVIFGFVAAGHVQSASAATNKATITLTQDKKQFAKKTVTVKKGNNLLSVMKKNFTVKEKDGFITSINGHKQDDAQKKYWMFTVNGKEATKGAKDIQVKKNDKVTFDLSVTK
ncbi:DUF4430 domain-containing protein [Furfurilactobacillus sp. WILCCON 0119]|uniref:DUF4430 domain-containing protein n=1 Tax=Furfurilactobacillus entadae TaxID=2922307 RepID=UPI0035EFEA8E